MGIEFKDAVNDQLVGERLAAVEGAVGLSGQEVADRIGVAGNAWSQYKAGKRTFRYQQARKLKAEFGVSADWLYFGDSERHHNSEAFNEKLRAWERRDPSADAPKRGRRPNSSEAG